MISVPKSNADERLRATTPGRTPPYLIILAIVIAGAVFTLDLSLPLGVAGGVPYVALVLLGVYFERSRDTYLLAVAGSVLTIVGYLFSPEGGVFWVVLTNRGLALFAIWITALLIASRKRNENQLRLARNNLESEVARRTKELQETENRLTAINDTVQAGILVWRVSDGMLILANRYAKDIFGAMLGDTFGKSWPEHFVNHKDYEQILVQFSAEGVVRNNEIELRRMDGGHIWVMLSMSEIPRSDDELLLVSFSDITKTKSAEQAMLIARNEAETANQTKSQFLANMSHELRTPLNAILGFSEIMQMQAFGPLGSDKYIEYIEDIQSSGSHLLALISDILQMSKIEAGSHSLRMETFEVPDLIRDCIFLVRGQTNDKNISLVNDIANDIPPLFADHQAIKQCLINLLSNAIKFTPEKGTVTISASISPQWYELTVSDTGIGVAKDDLDRLTQPFTQFERMQTARIHEGTGIGLNITRNLIEMHGGTLKFESEINVGTAVTICLPRGEMAVSEETDLSLLGQFLSLS